MSDTDWETICHEIVGTCKSEQEIADMYGVSEEDFLAKVNDYDVERCECCGWWGYLYDMDADLHCEDCQHDD